MHGIAITLGFTIMILSDRNTAHGGGVLEGNLSNIIIVVEIVDNLDVIECFSNCKMY